MRGVEKSTRLNNAAHMPNLPKTVIVIIFSMPVIFQMAAIFLAYSNPSVNITSLGLIMFGT